MQAPPRPASIPRAWPFKGYYGWAIVATGLVTSFGMVPVFGPVLGVFFAPIEEELGWSRATIALAFTIGSLTGTVSSFLFGRMIDRFGSRAIVVGAGFIITGAMLAIGAMQEPWQFWIAFGAGRGAALAGIQIGMSVTIANWFVRKRGRAMALRGVGQRAGQSLVPLMIVAVMAVASWRTAFFALAAFTAITIIIPGFLYLRRRPEDLGLHPDGAEGPVEGQGGGGRGGRFARQAHDVSWTLAQARRTRAFWLLVVVTAVDRFALGSINLHMVPNFVDQGLSNAVAATVLATFAATAALTGLPWGFLLEKIHVRYGAMLMAVLFAGSMGIILIADNYLLALTFALTFGLATGGSTILENMLYAEYFGRANLGAIRGFVAPFRAFAPIGPVMAGFIRDETGSYAVAFGIFLGVFVLMFVLMSMATPPKAPPAEPAEADA